MCFLAAVSIHMIGSSQPRAICDGVDEAAARMPSSSH